MGCRRTASGISRQHIVELPFNLSSVQMPLPRDTGVVPLPANFNNTFPPCYPTPMVKLWPNRVRRAHGAMRIHEDRIVFSGNLRIEVNAFRDRLSLNIECSISGFIYI